MSPITRRKFGQIIASGIGGAALPGSVLAKQSAEKPSGPMPPVKIVVKGPRTPKVQYGMDRLALALESAGLQHREPATPSQALRPQTLTIAIDPQPLPQHLRRPEGFSVVRRGDSEVHVAGFDEAGVMYACLELASRIRQEKGLPSSLAFDTTPKMALRGIPLFLMTAGSYDYPITESQFPWFYEKSLWTNTLDLLAENRFNFISLWNSHPFPYFVKLSKYPEVRELSDADLGRNVALMEWLSGEAEKRNVWLMFHFYNIHVPESFALAHGIPKNLGFNGYTLSEPDPLVSDYTRYCVGEFVRRFPSVGLYFPLGEALQKEKSFWMNEVLLAAVKDSGKHPPVILRQHELAGVDVLEKALPVYDNLYTEMKHNEEMYAAPQPNPGNAEWIKRSRKHVINVHLTGNLKPFRWGSPSFIHETAKAQQAMGARGVQVYPLWVWNWPYSADAEPLLQLDRDWLWYAAWGRYGWDADRPEEEEKSYWTKKIGERFGDRAAPYILASYDAAGKVMPIVPRLFWFDGWNHWFASNGLTVEQILSGTPIPYDNLPKTLSVRQYAQALAGGKETGEKLLTPTALATQMVSNAREAVEACQQAESLVEKNREEFARLQRDFEATLLIAQFYDAKIGAAVHFVAYQETRKPAEKDLFLELLGRSLNFYRELAAKTGQAYPAANDIRNDIPFPFHPPTGMSPLRPNSIPRLPHWRDFLLLFEAEFESYRRVLNA